MDWSKATQSTDPSGRWVVQIPLWWDENTLELLIVAIEHERVVDVMLSRITLAQDEKAVRVAFAHLGSKLAMKGLVTITQGKPVLEHVMWGRTKGTTSVGELVTISDTAVSPDVRSQQVNCNVLLAQLAAASAALAATTAYMLSTCAALWWAPPCWIALGYYAAALLAYYAALEAAKLCL